MKLLLLIESTAPESGGPAIEVARLAEMLSQTDMQVTLACLTPRDQSLPFHPNVHFFQFQNPVFPQPSWLRAVDHLKQLIKEHDLVFTSGIWGPIDGFALRLAWQLHKPVYIHICGMLEPYILARNPLKKRLAWMLYVRHNLNQASGIIVNSDSEARNVQKLGVSPEKILVIPNSIELQHASSHKLEARQRLGFDLSKPILLYLGRLHAKKGLHVLLQAMALLPAHKRNFSLLVAGDYSDKKYQAQIEDIVMSGNLQEMIHFSGLVTGLDKERHFQAADGFILPSQSEGQPNAVLEAMAYGLPVIITKGCNIQEVAHYGAGLVIELSVVNLTQALDWFITGGTPLSSASVNARRLMKERFNPEGSMHQYKQIVFNHKPTQMPPFTERGRISS